MTNSNFFPAAARYALIASVIGNLSLVALLLAAKGSKEQSQRQIRPNDSSAAPVNHPEKFKTRLADFHWSHLESPNYFQYISNLRSIGCPELTIREIILAEIDKLFAPRVKALGRPFRLGAVNYMGDPAERERQTKLAALRKGQKTILEQLLGVGTTDTEEEISGFHPDEILTFSYLPPEKRRRVLEIEKEFNLREQNVFRSNAGFFLPQDTQEAKAVREMKFAEIRKLLSPDEFEQYALRRSDLANELRTRFALFDLGDEEFAKLYRARAMYEIPVVPVGNVQAEALADQQRTLLANQLKQDFGEERYQQLERGNNQTYRDMVGLAKRYQLPADAADNLFALKSELDKRFSDLSKDENLSVDQRKASVEKARLETEHALANVLGDRVFNIYRDSPQGTWISETGAH